jgi:hypothetical protein
VVQPAPEADPAELLREQRSAIDSVYGQLEDLGPGADGERVASILARAFDDPALGFLVAVEGGPQRLIEQSVEEYLRFEPNEASNASSAAGLVRILLLQNIDLVWWADQPNLVDADALRSSEGFEDLRALRRRGHVAFSFGIGSDTILRRGRDFLVQRLFPNREPRGPGLAFTAIRRPMLAMLNEVAGKVAERVPEGTPPIRVTSIVRTVEHQQHLKTLGFSAFLPSVHCRGWAADVEVAWFRRFGADVALKEVLLEYLDSGILNVIDEGRAWHVCLSPAHVAHYEASARN